MAYTVETAAAESVDILKRWKTAHDEYKSVHADVMKKMQDADVSDEEFHKVSKREDELYAEHVRLCHEARALMSREVFSKASESECMDWIYHDYDGLIRDLADIACGDY